MRNVSFLNWRPPSACACNIYRSVCVGSFFMLLLLILQWCCMRYAVMLYAMYAICNVCDMLYWHVTVLICFFPSNSAFALVFDPLQLLLYIFGSPCIFLAQLRPAAIPHGSKRQPVHMNQIYRHRHKRWISFDVSPERAHICIHASDSIVLFCFWSDDAVALHSSIMRASRSLSTWIRMCRQRHRWFVHGSIFTSLLNACKPASDPTQSWLKFHDCSKMSIWMLVMQKLTDLNPLKCKH